MLFINLLSICGLYGLLIIRLLYSLAFEGNVGKTFVLRKIDILYIYISNLLLLSESGKTWFVINILYRV